MVDAARGDGSSEGSAGPPDPDESGKRVRPELIETFEELDDLVVIPREVPRRRVPPPPPPRALRRATPTARDRVDIDELVRESTRPTLGAAAATPSVPPPARRPTWTAAVGIAALALAVGAGSAVALSATRRAPAGTVAHAAAPPKEARPRELEALPPPTSDTARAEDTIAPPPPSVTVEGSSPSVEASEPARPERRVRRRRWRARSAHRARAEAPAAPSTEEVAPPTSDTTRAEPTGDASGAALIERPTREDVERAVGDVLAAVRGCAPGLGRADLDLHFAPTGRATTASVRAPLASPEQRSCIARAARAAQVPPFTAPRLHVSYPVQL